MAAAADRDTEPAVPRRRPGRPRLTEPSPEYRKRLEEIIDTATVVFHERGFDAGSLDDVAAVLGLSKASLYHYVRSKAQLLYLIFDRAITLSLHRLDAMSGIPDPRERLATLIAHQVRMVAEEPSLFAVFFDQRPRLDDSFDADIRRKERAYVRRVAEVVEAATAADGATRLDARHAAHALLGMTSWVYKWMDPVRDTPEDVARTMIGLVLGPGVPVPDGRVPPDPARSGPATSG
ncbi:TetR/AcrR family transcriptional regulator [Pseudonocardia sp. KRD-184]|uniref:TetR/AcrR family transcriptional regulator n=1 Tax=Pseudonocardia oceani TaxID=2792013 RepID=A0ABS6U2E6_9PSEU|nr:TetR/AcrR family transcriptional regulator [Pseudonocardia oceani]MBW0088120.1 TetR/AcrR family transcriptional regulator [Pseudonocardia oceani]MBW0096294.1 TetR/AcrR family transcriptional regulator [Pseudonocardia oceani]MBW0107150.1 TetR/AcrR family transcriptional regulator [Pseudonocardia oceani]MBW0119754.1 TetR/AcrR family transcriptional regulator [Pseudonocardia oceani]MBW0126417.1 TetR/AcrR family transcriptional regulator [Pseudonocardia oceani]